uniref:Ovule protein n=1 Tax=Syphacia muris TaxID=451379 RepID=A0A0N5ABH5_9BILA
MQEKSDKSSTNSDYLKIFYTNCCWKVTATRAQSKFLPSNSYWRKVCTVSKRSLRMQQQLGRVAWHKQQQRQQFCWQAKDDDDDDDDDD